ncbi:MAG: VCBS repeat-containing protein [Burkholderiaceae bacterium]|nr:VCBS repeat-containing protein [Burkholderiaceae bacterium]
MTPPTRAKPHRRPWATRLGRCIGAALLLGPAFAQAEEIVSARYAEPTDRYGHFALGRPHEYAAVVARTDAGRELTLALPANEVFEDLAPRLERLRPGAAPELLVIISASGQGARLALLGLDGDRLVITANAAPIGTANRWLNPVGVADLDGDGTAELAAVTTPHIAGVLRVYRRRGSALEEIAALPGFSNHVYGSAELRLSTTVRLAGRPQLLVPDQSRTAVRAMAWVDGRLSETARCTRPSPVEGPADLSACAEAFGAQR